MIAVGKKKRPPRLSGWTYRQETPAGTLYVTINTDDQGQPFEMFITTAKSGSETAAVSEAMGRLISYILRMEDHVLPLARLIEIGKQLGGIGGGRAVFGDKQPRSIADGVAHVIQDYIVDQEDLS